MKLLTKKQLAKKLAECAKDMRQCADALTIQDALGECGQHGVDLAGQAVQVEQWAKKLKK